MPMIPMIPESAPLTSAFSCPTASEPEATRSDTRRCAPTPAGSLLLMLGTVLADAYEIDGLLGSGGMAQVFAARDRRLGRPVAVKVARPGMASALQAEGRALARIRHPSIVGILHAGSHHEVTYLVIERIPGRSLRSHTVWRRRARSAISEEWTVLVLRKLARALAVVHAAGLSHRDVKPENVMLSPGGRVVLTDFGLARWESESPDDGASGSPSYMAPEVIATSVRRGEGHLVDLYALGVVAYELLVGALPFDHDGRSKILAAHLADPPPDPRERRPDVSPALAKLVMQLMAKAPEERPQSARAVEKCLLQVRSVAWHPKA